MTLSTRHETTRGSRVRMPAALLLALTALVAGCTTASPPTRLYRLPAEVPGAAATPVATAADPRDGWQLMTPVRLPAYLDRDPLVMPQGAAGLQPLPSQRWAEPLRDAVPRLLRADIAALRSPAPVWSPPLPPGAAAPRQLRVELLAFESTPGRDGVRLQARWTLADADGTRPPREGQVAIEVPSAGPGIDALVAAHRIALRRLAEAIVR